MLGEPRGELIETRGNARGHATTAMKLLDGREFRAIAVAIRDKRGESEQKPWTLFFHFPGERRPAVK